jgi:hypothetical protein
MLGDTGLRCKECKGKGWIGGLVISNPCRVCYGRGVIVSHGEAASAKLLRETLCEVLTAISAPLWERDRLELHTKVEAVLCLIPEEKNDNDNKPT